VGWLSLAALVFGTTYGLPVVAESSLGERTISLAGVVLIYGMLFMFSSNHKAVQVRTVVLGIGFQFIIALFVFRTGAGYSLFEWIAIAAADLLKQGQIGGAAFFCEYGLAKCHGVELYGIGEGGGGRCAAKPAPSALGNAASLTRVRLLRA
jgi:hypothetical protein